MLRGNNGRNIRLDAKKTENREGNPTDTGFSSSRSSSSISRERSPMIPLQPEELSRRVSSPSASWERVEHDKDASWERVTIKDLETPRTNFKAPEVPAPPSRSRTVPLSSIVRSSVSMELPTFNRNGASQQEKKKFSEHKIEKLSDLSLSIHMPPESEVSDSDAEVNKDDIDRIFEIAAQQIADAQQQTAQVAAENTIDKAADNKIEADQPVDNLATGAAARKLAAKELAAREVELAAIDRIFEIAAQQIADAQQQTAQVAAENTIDKAADNKIEADQPVDNLATGAAARKLAAKELAAKEVELAAKELAAKELAKKAAEDKASKELAEILAATWPTTKEHAGKELAAKELAAKELAAKELAKKAAEDTASKELAEILAATWSTTKDHAGKELAAKELAAKELAAKELAKKAAEDTASKELAEILAATWSTTKDHAGKELAAKELAAKELAAKELAKKAAEDTASKELAEILAATWSTTKDHAGKELAAKELAAKELAAKELAEKAAADKASKELAERLAALPITQVPLQIQVERITAQPGLYFQLPTHQQHAVMSRLPIPQQQAVLGGAIF